MRYTVWSRGRVIGETDLGFRRFLRRFRSGWFEPNAEGERVMPVVAAVSPAMHACFDDLAQLGTTAEARHRALRSSPQYADLKEALQRVEALDLQVRREDGSVVRTVDVAIQDTHQLIQLARLDLEAEPFEPDPLSPDDADAWDGDDGPGWEVDDGCFSCMALEPLDDDLLLRYQIHVMLAAGEVLP